MSKIYRLPVPNNILASGHSLITYIHSALFPGLPLNKVEVAVSSLENLYRMLQGAVNRRISAEACKALRLLADLPEFTPAEHKAWLDQQKIEVHVDATSATPGHTKCKFVMFGPSCTSGAGGAIELGDEDLVDFSLASFMVDKKYRISIVLDGGSLPVEGVPFLSVPLFHFHYEMKKDGKNALTFEQVVRELYDYIHENKKRFMTLPGMENAKEPILLPASMFGDLDDTLQNLVDWHGGFDKPTSFDFTAISYPSLENENEHILLKTVQYRCLDNAGNIPLATLVVKIAPSGVLSVMDTLHQTNYPWND